MDIQPHDAPEGIILGVAVHRIDRVLVAVAKVQLGQIAHVVGKGQHGGALGQIIVQHFDAGRRVVFLQINAAGFNVFFLAGIAPFIAVFLVLRAPFIHMVLPVSAFAGIVVPVIITGIVQVDLAVQHQQVRARPVFQVRRAGSTVVGAAGQAAQRGLLAGGIVGF